MTDNIHNTASLLQPVQPNERIAALHVIRGFALFGVLLSLTGSEIWETLLKTPTARRTGRGNH